MSSTGARQPFSSRILCAHFVVVYVTVPTHLYIHDGPDSLSPTHPRDLGLPYANKSRGQIEERQGRESERKATL
ncbi:hypothetical protein PROFUN_02589 [Planoprotostelium fungivorum]|uniref:Uncharacterized protein n=1 Tax=Planoprotostelium fungivorum TaxID=1890364 RepID=A0A2P6MPE6_9EUKA|nr:hypothetical protein PROFUN_02589 [Planoprotostelium fungivorum]